MTEFTSQDAINEQARILREQKVADALEFPLTDFTLDRLPVSVRGDIVVTLAPRVIAALIKMQDEISALQDEPSWVSPEDGQRIFELVLAALRGET